jgi:hypothetical protein
MVLFLLLFACNKGGDTGEAATAPTVEWLNPIEGDSLTAGPQAASLLVEHFSLVDPAKHSEGGAAGYVGVSVDGAEVLLTGSTTVEFDLVAGAHEIAATLYYDDGDEVSAKDGLLCEEGDAGCATVEAVVAVTVN